MDGGIVPRAPLSFEQREQLIERKGELIIRANQLIVLEHLHAALRCGVSTEVMKHLIAAIRELERQ
jgi:hypothetical protein